MTEGRILLVRGIRAGVDAVARITIPAYLLLIGLDATRAGLVVTVSMIGSAVATVALTAARRTITTRSMLLAVAALMAVTGLGWSIATTVPLVLIVAALGTANIGGGDVSPFVPLEQAAIAATSDEQHHVASLARLELVGALIGTLGAAAAGAPIVLTTRLGGNELTGHRAAFLLYAIGGIAVILVLATTPRPQTANEPPAQIPHDARRSLARLTALFVLDSFASGFASHAVIALWLYHRFALSPAIVGAIFAVAGIGSSISGLLAAPLAHRFGAARAMVVAHVPASVLLVAMALAPTLWLTLLFFALRSLTARIDAPIRSAVVLAMVEPGHRAFASAVTNIPRSLAAGIPAVAAGALIDADAVVWSFIICAGIKLLYDALLYRTLTPRKS